MNIKYIAGLFSVIFSGLCYADCPSNLDAESTVQCITIEGAGQNYQEWKRDFNKSMLISETNSTVSPITGKDIREVKPAAGKNSKKL